MTKKIISFLMTATIVLSMLLCFSGCSPKASEGLEFKSNGDGTCAWVGIGTCTDTEIIVPKKNGDETVVSVASDTLNFEIDTVTKVVLPKTIKTIEKRAFDRLRSLVEIKLNEGLESIGEYAFYGCEALESINFPSTLKSIGEWAFCECKLLTEIVLPEGFEELGKFSFSGCNAVKKISIPSTLNKLHFISADGGNCGYEFDTTSIEEFTFAGDWKYTTLDMGMSDEGKIYFYGSLARDISNEKYPGTFDEITEKNKESVLCALLNKQSLKINNKDCSITSEKPVGIYEVPGMWGFTLQEFTKDNKLNVSYEQMMGGVVKDVVSNSYTYDEKLQAYTFSQSITLQGQSITIEKIFVNFGDFIFSVDYYKVDSSEDTSIYKWIPYSETIKEYIEEDVELEEDKVEEIVEKKDNLLNDLIEAFKAAGIKVNVDETTGELALDSSVLFGGDSAVLTAEGKTFLNKFVNVYTSIVFSDKYEGFVSKTLIEGHTAPVSGSTYESGLPLSEQRANNVKNYCVSSETGVDTSKLAANLEATGLSNSKPVYDNSGKVDMAASRRVSFRFIINLE